MNTKSNYGRASAVRLFTCSLSILSACILLSNSAVADDESESESGFIVGLGGAYEKQVYVGAEEDSVSAVPYLAYESERLTIGLGEIAYSVLSNESYDLGVFIEQRSMDDLKKGSQFAELKRDKAIEVGISGDLSLGPIFLAASAQTDLSDAHEGTEIRLSVGSGLELGEGELGLSVSAIHQDKKLGHYLYGVNKKDGIAGTPLYAPDEDWSMELETTYTYPLSGNMALISGASINFLSDAAQNSPRIQADADSVKSAFVGVMWLF